MVAQGGGNGETREWRLCACRCSEKDTRADQATNRLLRRDHIQRVRGKGELRAGGHLASQQPDEMRKC